MSSNQYKSVRAKNRQKRRKLLIQQRLMGIVMIVLTVFFVWLCSTGNEDCSAAFLTGPLGLILLFSKDIMIY